MVRIYMHPSPPPRLPMTSIDYKILNYYPVNGEIFTGLNPYSKRQTRASNFNATNYGTITLNYEDTPEDLQEMIRLAGGADSDFLFKVVKDGNEYYFRGLVLNHWKYDARGSKLINSRIELCSEAYY